MDIKEFFEKDKANFIATATEKAKAYIESQMINSKSYKYIRRKHFVHKVLIESGISDALPKSTVQFLKDNNIQLPEEINAKLKAILEITAPASPVKKEIVDQIKVNIRQLIREYSEKDLKELVKGRK
jgi:hypothetical protein